MVQDINAPVTAVEVPLQEKRILIVEDEVHFANAVKKHLGRAGFKCVVANDLSSAKTEFKEFLPDLVLLDMRLPDGSGLEFLAEIRNQQKSTVAVLIMSAYGEIEDAVSAMKRGASDYLKKPVDLDELLINVEKVLYREEISLKLAYSGIREQHAAEEVEFLGDSPAMDNVRTQIERISQLTQVSDSVPPTVLILGETGTGKDVVARILHARSARQQKPFVHVDCASLPKDLIEAELFGHEKGAFTSAHVARTGLIEAAEDGVLFMDEIGELPLDLQTKLLAVLERRTLRRVGTSQERPVSAWFVAATNRDIAGLAETGEFRSDLYYRLNVLTITMPALRDREADAVLLAEYFSGLTAKRYGLPKVKFSTGIKTEIKSYHWPGNVRELKHMIERAVLLSGGGELQAENLLLTSQPATAEAVTLPQDQDLTLEAAEMALIKQALERTGYNVSRAARELGITRMALRYRMKKYNL